MILSGHQPEYLPYLGFFHKMLLSDQFVIVDHVQFQKKCWQNRNRIRSSQGELMLTVPVLSKGSFEQPIKDVKINQQENWRRKHWQSIQLNYKKAPYFADLADFFEQLYTREWEDLAELNIAIIQFLAQQLKLDKKMVRSSGFMPEGKKTDLLISLCHKLDHDTYLSGSGGRTYVEEDKFKAAGLKSVYIDFKHPVYKQQHEPFLPNLSAIDLLFNCGPEQSRELLENAGGMTS